MKAEEHRKRHEELHMAFDELMADFIGSTERLPSRTTLVELMDWSHKQAQCPAHAAPLSDGDSLSCGTCSFGFKYEMSQGNRRCPSCGNMAWTEDGFPVE